MTAPTDLLAGEEMAAWLRDHGWIRAPNGTWGYPHSTARSLKTETAFHIGQLIAEMDDD